MNDNKQNMENQKNIFSQMEEEVMEFWQRAGTFEKSVEKEAPKGDYVFYDGPPFITGLPHYATLLPSIAKDVVPRYWTMKGYRVERVWGWDCHGLPAENKVEQQLGLKNKKDIEKLGVGKFIDACRDYVNVGSEQWEWYIHRIVRWVDMKSAYKTMDLKFMESVIWAFKQLYDKGLIYEGYRSSLHCPRCATPLSKFEITMDAGSYKDVTDKTVVVKFKVRGLSDSELGKRNLESGSGKWEVGSGKLLDNMNLLAWTTTPWTLPGNLALAVGEGIEYLVFGIKGSNEAYIIAKDRAEEILKDIEYDILTEIKGSDLVGLEYEPLFDLRNEAVSSNDKAYKVYAGDFVTTEDGTGIVHIAPNFGEADFELGKTVGLPMVDLMDENGVYTDQAGEWSGQYFSKAGKKALDELGNKMFSSFDYTHSYPHCYRCSTPLIFRSQKAWYLKISEIRERMLEENEKINWVPEYFKEGRFKYNIEAAPDWSLSRSRYWGSPIPVWKCAECGDMKVVGSLQDIEDLSGVKLEDLHKPGIDEVEFKCGKCQAQMKRVPEVLDCWFESGSMPFAQFHYPFERQERWGASFPADFIIEYTGQLRGWFYYLHVLGISLFNSLAFKNVIVSGVLAGTDGRKMSKSYGNYPDPRATLDKYGTDALRQYFMSSAIMLGDDMNLSEEDVQNALRKNVMLVWNILSFYLMFAGKDQTDVKRLSEENILDKWIMARLKQLIAEVTENMEKYDLPHAARPITDFINDFSTWYIRRSRDRFKGEDKADKEAAIATTGYVLLELSKVMAPFMPFMAERIWQAVTGFDFKDEDRSVHLEGWTEKSDQVIGEQGLGNTNSEIIAEMDVVRKIVELGLAARDAAGIKVRQPLNKLKVEGGKLKVGDEFVALIKDEVNVREVEFAGGEGDLSVELDTEISEELKQEGVMREVVRFVNALRKDAGLTIENRVVVAYSTEDEAVKEAVTLFKEQIMRSTLADEIIGEQTDDINIGKDVKVNGVEVWLGVKRV